ncbi:MAG: [Clostridia bacterium]|nr:[FeFe] hydrogenase H-cluster radical SAM maturase HydE [Clostridia bacterium]
MNDKLLKIVQKLISTGSLETTEYEDLIDNRNEEIADFLKNEAVKKRKSVYGNTVFIRGLIEISNICKNDCLYCGIRCGNKGCDRYRLTKEEILSCCDEGYSLGFRTFVM